VSSIERIVIGQCRCLLLRDLVAATVVMRDRMLTGERFQLTHTSGSLFHGFNSTLQFFEIIRRVHTGSREVQRASAFLFETV